MFGEQIKKVGFTQNPDKPCVYLKASGSNVAFLVFYVDDILIMGNNISMLQDIKSWLGKCFSMKELGEAAYIIRIKITRDRSKWLITLIQNAYLDKVLKRYKMENFKRGNILMQEKPNLSKAQVLLHLKRVNLGNELSVTCYTDAGFQTDKDDTKSQSGYVFMYNEGVVDWKSAKQSTIAMSSTKPEYIVVSKAAMEAVWMRKFIDRLGNAVSTNKEPMEML
uniref:Reverse transcriptase Ty1/copia-type domain-containing protein n=1 Tax=Tanacetum cinerariifolium TaxID=118510 RepID=A0A6L2N6H4_TANCI|nr:hypothetical protein [Tanacetum cinerariifolium]